MTVVARFGFRAATLSLTLRYLSSHLDPSGNV